MGREIRRVPIDWQHPKRTAVVRGADANFIPLYGHDYQVALREWEQDKAQWDAGTHRYQDEESTYEDVMGQRPDPDDYMPQFTEPCDGWCVYETVSEGTPVTPVFATPEELIDYLCEHGDFSDQIRRKDPRIRNIIPCSPWPREHAERFVRSTGWAPTLVAKTVTASDDQTATTIKRGIEF